MNITMMQTSDPHAYIDLSAETRKINELYCSAQGISYQIFEGIKRGYQACQAKYNRIIMLAEAKNDPTLDWIVYLDADAYMYDPGVSLYDYLRDKGEWSLIIEKGADNDKWDVNDVAFFVNMRHPMAKKLIGLWESKFLEEISDEDLKSEVATWSLPSDSALLHDVLRENPDILDSVLVVERGHINYGKGKHIRQAPRPDGATAERIEQAKHDISPLLEHTAGLPPAESVRQFVPAPGLSDNPVMAPELEINTVADGYIVYQPDRNKVHHLNPTAVLLLELCNGRNSEADLPRLVQMAYDLAEPPVKEVAACLETLRKEGLIQQALVQNP